MKKITKKLLLLVAVMTLVVCMVFSASAIDYTATLGSPIEIGVDDFEYSTNYYISFTPTTSGDYYFKTSNPSGVYQTEVYFYDTDSYFDEYYDYINCYYDETLYYEFTAQANTTYYFRTYISLDEGDFASYDFSIHKVCLHADANKDKKCDACGEAITTISGNCGGEGNAADKWYFTNTGLLEIRGEGVFYNTYSSQISKKNVTSIVISEGITEIPEEAFKNFTNLKSVTIPSTVGYIGNGAFYGCSSLASVTIPEKVTDIYSETFYGCSALTTVNIPANIVSINDSAFDGCTGITKYTVSAGNENFAADAYGALYDDDFETLYYYPLASARTDYELPASVEYIANNFYSAKNLKKLTVKNYNIGFSVGESVEEIFCYPFSTIYKRYIDSSDVMVTSIGGVRLTELKVEKNPYKTTYVAGQDYFSADGMELVAVMSDGTKVEFNPDRDDVEWNEGRYSYIPKGITAITFKFEDVFVASVPITVVDETAFAVGLAAPKALTGTKNSIYFTPSVTDDYLISVDADLRGYIQVYRYQNTDDKNNVDYRLVKSVSFDSDSLQKEGAFRLVKGVKYKITINLYLDSEEEAPAAVNSSVIITYDCDHDNTKEYGQQNPTCTAKGYAAGTYCFDCKKWIKGHDEIAALGHSIAASHITAPATMNANGLATGKCAVCNAVLNQATVAKIASVKLEETKYDYNGKMKKPAVIVTDANGKVLVEGTDYVTVYASGRKEIGTYGVTVKFINNYSGAKELKFKIVFGTATVTAKKATANSITLAWKKVATAKTYEVYSSTNGKSWKKIGTTKKTSYEVKGLKAATGYKFKVKAIAAKNESTSKVVGLATSLSKKVSLASVKAGAGQFTANWKAVKGITGYEVAYSTAKKFTANKTATATVKKAKLKKTTVKGLSKGKYFVKVRAFKTVNGAKAYGPYSAVKTVKVK